MNTALLDVNVLVALHDPAHPNHEDAHRWFGRNRKRGWATSPVTVNGCVRVLSNPAYPTVLRHRPRRHRVSECYARIPVIEFWSDSVSLLDDSLFRLQAITGHRQITDLYLLGLAVRHGGRLATFDRSIPFKAVVGAGPAHLELIGSAPTSP